MRTKETTKTSSPICFMRIAIGLVYLWFGTLKFFPGLSPAEELATDTISMLTFHMIAPNLELVLLAILEVVIGVFLILNIKTTTAIYMALFHIFFTFSPLFFFYDKSFNGNPIALTLVGQYIIKNLIIIGALWVILKDVKTYGKSINIYPLGLFNKIFGNLTNVIFNTKQGR
ncbi:DoxX family membrane protein [Maribacter sp. CXY002]|uniref:DoxX family membrane protein n=1 Tax=Maribacter luteocoastalis TaxID=3407671 RepID=UPI003B6839A9